MLRRILAGLLAFAAGAACVDLFHDTNFQTLCDTDTAACGADAGAPDVITLDPIDFCREYAAAEALEQAKKTCALLGACEGTLGETAFGPCVLRARSVFDCALNPNLRPLGTEAQVWSCLVRARTCKEAKRCLVRRASAPCPAVASGSFTQCDVDSRIECVASPTAGPPHASEPCELRGQTCSTINGSFAFCTGSGKAGCNNDGGSCSNNAAVNCAPIAGTSVDRGRRCDSIGAGTCAEADGLAACVPGGNAETCDGGIAIACADDAGVATSCVGGRLVRMNCAALGTVCDISEPVNPSDPLMACADRTSAGRCTGPDTCVNGTTITSCANGRAFTANCSELGLGTCEVQNDLARCTGPTTL